MRKEKGDPDPGGPKTCGSGSGSGSPTLQEIITMFGRTNIFFRAMPIFFFAKSK
jgi:hypothetical protein